MSVTDESIYGKCSKIPNTFLALFSNKMFVFRATIHKMLIRIANREDPDQTASSEAVQSGSAVVCLDLLSSNWCSKFKNIFRTLTCGKLLFGSLCPSQKIFSYVGTGLPGLNQY